MSVLLSFKSQWITGLSWFMNFCNEVDKFICVSKIVLDICKLVRTDLLPMYLISQE